MTRELEHSILKASDGEKKGLQERLTKLRDECVALELSEKESQSQGNVFYWPVFNLDQKNPNLNSSTSYVEPSELVASMCRLQEEVGGVILEIKDLMEGFVS